MGAALALSSMAQQAQAGPCNRKCAKNAPRDAHGCCLKKAGRKAGRKTGRKTGKKAGPRRSSSRTKTVKGKAGVQWVSIPGGRFVMGSARGAKNERPVHRVRVSSFWMNRSEVTVGQYRQCMGIGICKGPSGGNCQKTYLTLRKPGKQDHPINCVGVVNARKFCAWIGGRLPSEAEWEHAARGAGLDRRYPWGKAAPSCKRVVIKSCGVTDTAPVCSRPAGNTAQGLCDMAGNVQEIVDDSYHHNYDKAPADGSAWEPDKNTPSWTARGGAWTFPADRFRSAARSVSLVGSEAHTGFRCAISSRPDSR